MGEKLRVYNNQKFDIGVRLQDKPMGVNIAPGSFIQMTKDDIDYVSSVSSLFRKGLLRVEAPAEKEVMMGIGVNVDTDPNFIDEADIRKNLSLSARNMEKWLDGITEPHVLDRIYDTAMSMNLNMSKIKVLKEKMPNKSFLDE